MLPILVTLLACAIVIPCVQLPRLTSRGRTQAAISSTRATLKTLTAALKLYQSDTGRLPTTAEGLKALRTPPPNVPIWHGPYIARPPVDPWGNPYTYRTLTPTTFDLRSTGPDAKPNTPDDIIAPP